MESNSKNVTSCKYNNCHIIFIILGILLTFVITATSYFLVRCNNQQKAIIQQLALHSQFIDEQNHHSILDHDFEYRVKNLFDNWTSELQRPIFNILRRNMPDYYTDSNNHFDHISNSNVGVSHSSVQASDNQYLITLSIPGFTKDQINIKLENNMLSIVADYAKTSEEGDNKSKLNKSFKQKLRLNNDIDPDNIKTTLQDGVLTITIPRLPQKTVNKEIVIE
jgi:HSP20 family molecular chaperone IbpA